MSPIRSRMEAENWLARRLALEGPGLWTVREYHDLGKKLARDYRPRGPKWRVKEWTHGPEGNPVYVVTRGGDFGIHRVDDPVGHLLGPRTAGGPGHRAGQLRRVATHGQRHQDADRHGSQCHDLGRGGWTDGLRGVANLERLG